MVEKLVIVHRDAMKDWLTWSEPRLEPETIIAALAGIEELEGNTSPQLIVELTSGPYQPADLSIVTQLVGKDNTALLVGARRSVCIAVVGAHLERAGIQFEIDELGVVD